MAADAIAVLVAEHLSRAYGPRRRRVTAVKDVSFSVARGEIYGLIGPDGAGKTSIIQMLAGVLRPHAGRARVAGIDVEHDPDAVKRRVGYMPQGLGVNLYDSLTAAENIEFFRRLRQLPDHVFNRNRADLVAMTRLGPFLTRRASQLSGGMRQKLALICTLIHLPDVLLLDEPTTGVDPISRQDFWQIIRGVVEARAATVLLSTSYMDEAERCHRIALLHDGVTIAEGRPDDVRGLATGRYASIVAEPQQEALARLRRRSDIGSTEVFGEDIHIRFDGELREIERDLASAGIAVRHVAVQEPDLEDVFLQELTKHQTQPAAFHFAPARGVTVPVAIECRHATRRFGTFTAVDGVDIRVPRGQIFGLLGPNGAGKTTLIKMMCGLLEPTDGTIEIAGVNVRTERDRLRIGIGYMSQRFSLYRDLSVRQNLRLYSDLYAIDSATVRDMTGRLGLEPFTTRLASDLPSGVRQRLSLSCAVLHRPPVVFLDEPTSGVDPFARRLFWDLIYSLARESGVTVLVSTHYMDEAAHCDRLGLMHQGRLIAVGSPSELRDSSEAASGHLLAVRAADLHAAFTAIRTRFPDAGLFGDAIHVRTVAPDADQLSILRLLDQAADSRVRVEPVALSMDETFIDFIRRTEHAHA